MRPTKNQIRYQLHDYENATARTQQKTKELQQAIKAKEAQRKMKLVLFTVHDSKTEAFIQPYYALTVAAGLRMFETAANDDNQNFHRHAGDYCLFELGTFDQDTATFDLHSTPINHGLALSHLHNPVLANAHADGDPGEDAEGNSPGNSGKPPTYLHHPNNTSFEEAIAKDPDDGRKQT